MTLLMRRVLPAILVVSSMFLIGAVSSARAIQDFPLPTGDAGLIEASQGPFYGNGGIVSWQGALWFAEQEANNIGKITPGGQITEYPVPSAVGNPGSGPFALSAARQDQLWFLSEGSPLEGRVAKLDPNLGLTYLNLVYNRATSIAADPNGGAWFTYRDGEGISYFDQSGQEHFFGEARYSDPSPITVGSDGAAWFGDSSSAIKRIDKSGNLRNFNAPGDGDIVSMTSGPDGAIWYTKFNPGSGFFGPPASGGIIGRMSLSGSPRVFTPQQPSLVPSSLISGPDKALWFTIGLGSGIGRMDLNGKFSVLDLPDGRSADSISFGPDGALWFTDSRLNRIGRITRPEFNQAIKARLPRVLSKKLTVGRKRAGKVKVSCPAVANAICGGRVLLRKGKRAIGNGSYRLKPGSAALSKVTLNRKGRILARARGSVKVTIILRSATGEVVTKAIRLS